MSEHASDRDPRDVLNDKERRLARIISVSPDVPLWRAGWLAGYCNADPDGPEPDQQARKNLAKSAKRALDRPRVQAEIDRLRGLSAAETQERARVGDPVAKLEVEARERRLDALTADRDVVDIGADLLQLKLGAAFADPAEFVTWEPFDNGLVAVKGSDDMTVDQRRLIQKIQFHPTCQKCGKEHPQPGLTLELVPRATFAAQATKQLGLDAPKKLEVAGKDGGPIQIGVEVGVSRDMIQAIRHLIIGRPVEPTGAAG